MRVLNLVLCDLEEKLGPFTKDFREALAACEKLLPVGLPYPSAHVVIYVNPAFTIKGYGVGGYSPSKNLILVSVDPEFSELPRTIQEDLPGILAHELHHCLRWSGPGYGDTLLAALVTEGLACDFERFCGRARTARYIPTLSAEELERLFSLAALELDSKSYQHSDWFFGNRERNIPPCAGYAMGLCLIDRFKAAASKGTLEIYNVSHEDLRVYCR